MRIIVFLIVISLVVAVGFLIAFYWAIKDGQYEDDVTPAMRILLEDDMLPIQSDEQTQSIIIQTKPTDNV